MRRRISTSSFPSREAWLREDLTCPVLPSWCTYPNASQVGGVLRHPALSRSPPSWLQWHGFACSIPSARQQQSTLPRAWSSLCWFAFNLARWAVMWSLDGKQRCRMFLAWSGAWPHLEATLPSASWNMGRGVPSTAVPMWGLELVIERSGCPLLRRWYLATTT
jgi:hypothetical protein